MNVQLAAFMFGCLLLMVAIVGGGFELKELKLPKVGRASRLTACVFGMLFICLGTRPDFVARIAPAPAPAPAPAAAALAAAASQAPKVAEATPARLDPAPVQVQAPPTNEPPRPVLASNTARKQERQATTVSKKAEKLPLLRRPGKAFRRLKDKLW